MAQDLSHLVAGNHLYYCREGTTVDGVVIAPENPPPDTSPVENWTDVGCIESLLMNPETSFWEPQCPSPGAYEDSDKILLSKKLTYQITFNQVSNFYFQLVFNTQGPVPDAAVGGGFEPNDSDGQARGWFQVETYDQNNAILFAIHSYGSASIDGSGNFNNEGSTWDMTLTQLKSPHNAGGLWNHTWTAPA